MEPILILGALGLLAAAAAGSKPKGGSASPGPTPAPKPKPQVVIEEGARDPGAPPPGQTQVVTDAQQLRDFAESLAKALGLEAVQGTSNQQIAAKTLRAYILKTNDFGTAKPSAQIKKLQAAMGGGLKADGIVGPLTRSRSLVLGVELPGAQVRKPTTKPAAKPPTAAASASKPEPYWLPAPSAPASATAAPAAKPPASKPPAAVKPATPAPKPKPKTPIPADAKSAAQSLRTHLESGGSPGTKEKPDPTLRALQSRMGGLTADGIYGPKTQTRAKALGVTLKARASYLPKVTIGPAVIEKTSPMLAPKAVNSPQKQAAVALAAHLEAGGAPGTKAKPDATVKKLQKAMAGGIVADGIYGPKSEARARALGANIRPRAAYAE